MSDSKNYASISVFAVEGYSDESVELKMREIPILGDTIILKNKGVFKVIERGQIANSKNLSSGWVRLENVNDPNSAPGSDLYRFMERSAKVER